MTPFTTSIVVFVCVFGGAIAGMAVRTRIPSEHLIEDSKDTIKVAMGLVATTVALVLGLLVSAANSFYDSQSAQVTRAAASVVVLDRMLVHYGPEAAETRAGLRSFVSDMMEVIWHRDSGATHLGPGEVGKKSLIDTIQELEPKSDAQRSLQAQGLDRAINLGEARWLLFTQRRSSVPGPLLVMLVFWLTVLFMSFGVFVRPNATVVVSLCVAALAITGAIFLILEMYQPFTGLIQVSDAPLQTALAQISR